MDLDQPWWDERFAELGLEIDEDVATPGASKIATVDLDDAYLRSLFQIEDNASPEIVVRAFGTYPDWQALDVSVDEGVSMEKEVSGGTDSSSLHWGEYEGIDWERVQAGEVIASSYCIRKGLIRKAHLAHNLKKWNAKHPAGRLVRAVPETLIMVLDDIEYFEEALSDVYEIRDMEEGSQIWIAKPSLTNQALEICIFDRVSTLRTALEANPDLREWVLQRYIERPLLLSGRKFHIRTYVLCIGSLQCYVFSEMLALFAQEPYKYGNENLSDLSAHLTNTCRLAKENPKYEENEAVKLVSELSQKSHSDSAKSQSLQAEGVEQNEAESRVTELQKDILDISSAGCCMEAVSSELTFFTLPNCFELFGFDFLVDEAWNVWLLEANAEPDMRQTGQRLKGLIVSLVTGVLQLLLGPDAYQEGSQGSEPHSTAESIPGKWIKVFEKQQRA